MKAYDVVVYSKKLLIAEHDPKNAFFGFHVVTDAGDLSIFPSAMLLEEVPLHSVMSLRKGLEKFIVSLLNKKPTINSSVARELTWMIKLSPYDSLYLKCEVPEMLACDRISKEQIRTFLLSIWAKQYGFKEPPEYFLTLCDNLYIMEPELPIGEFVIAQNI